MDVTAPDLAVLIGRHGRTLDALQVMFSLLVSRKRLQVSGCSGRRGIQESPSRTGCYGSSAAERDISALIRVFRFRP